MTKICKRCNEERKKTSFRMLKCRNGERGDVCRWCYDNNQLKELKRTPEQIASQRHKLKGRKYNLERRLAISRGQIKAIEQGRHHWKCNDFTHRDQDRCRIKYKIWKEQVFILRGKKCKECGNEDRLHCHHIECYYEHPEKRFDPYNGEILCISCHMRHHRNNGGIKRKKFK